MYVKLVSCNAAPSFAGYANPPAFGNERCFGVVAAVPELRSMLIATVPLVVFLL